jgi:rod shape determining protein RodA
MQERGLAQRLHLDLPLLSGLVVLCAIGLVVLYSAAGQDAGTLLRQASRLLIAAVFMFLIAQFPPQQLARWAPAAYVLGIVLLVLVLVIGDIGKGAQRWLDLGVLRFQPSELMKLVLPMVLAWYLSERGLPPTPGAIATCSVVILLPVVLIAKQPDLGTAALVGIAGATVLFVAGISWRLMFGLGLAAALSMPVLWHLLHDYQRRRVLTFLDPEQDPLGAGYHIIQSKIAVGSGGLYGKGWLNGTQSHLDFLPERSTDFIFAVFCEEFGFLGVLLLVAIYALIIARALTIVAGAQHTFGRLFGSGIVMTFFAYVLINMGMVAGQFPVVGVPLPLISFGGTSMVTILAGFGIVMAICTHRRFLAD